MNPTESTEVLPGIPAKEARRRTVRSDTLNAIAFFGDLTMIMVGLLFGFWLRFQSGLIPFQESWWTTGGSGQVRLLRDYLGLIVIGALLLVFTFGQLRLYQTRNLLRFRRVAAIVVRGSVFWLLAYLSVSLVLKFNPPISRIYVASSAIGVVAAMLAWRGLYCRVLQSEWAAPSLRQRVLFVGWNEEAARIAAVIHSDASHPYDIVGCVPMENRPFSKEPGAQIRCVGEYAKLPELLRSEAINIAILADLGGSPEAVVQVNNLCERMLVQFKVIPTYFQILVSGLHLETISSVPILGVAELPLDRLTNRVLKRTVDIIGALVGLLLSAPLIAIFGVLIYLESPGPVFYRQVRTGRRGENFKIIKLRSMKLDAESRGGAQWAKKNDDRRLRVGAFMRETNIDEVPQFWNVLKGEMSLVGPRPERPELISGFQFEIPHYNARLMSKPGITGWAQVNGLRGDTDLTERVRYDLYYLENWSLMLDFQIMFQTFVSRKNAY